MTRRANRFFMQQLLREMNFDEPAFAQHPTLLGAQLESPEREQLTRPEKMLKKKRAVPQVHWMPSPLLVQANRQKPPGTHCGHPLPRGTAKGIAPCKGNVPGHIKNFEDLRISVLVSRCFERLLKRMPFPIEIA